MDDRKVFEDVLNLIGDCEKIVIYGAGRYGQLFLKQLYSWGIYKKGCFAETFSSGMKEVMGWDVCGISDVIQCTEKSVIVVAVSTRYMEEMVSRLEQLGIKNYIVLTDSMRRVLRALERVCSGSNRTEVDIGWLENEMKKILSEMETTVIQKLTEIVDEIISIMDNAKRVPEHELLYIAEKLSGIGTVPSEPLISVLVPVYNVEPYLIRCLNSLYNQSFTNFEVVCINDGSTDESLNIIEGYMTKDPRFRVISKNNTGYGDSMNHGLKAAKGKYVAILESDDFAEYDMLQRLYTASVTYRADVVVANYYIYHHEENYAEFHELLRGMPYGRILNKEEQRKLACATPSIWKGLYRKEFLILKGIDFLPTRGASYQDTSFAFKSYMSADRIVPLKDPVLYYRRGHETASVRDTSKVFCICDEFEEIRHYIENNNCVDWYPTYAQALLDRYYWNYNRLSGNAKEKFLEKYIQDVRECVANGWISKKKVMSRDRKLFEDML